MDARRAGAGYESMGHQVVTSERPAYYRCLDYSGLTTMHADLITTPRDRDLDLLRPHLTAKSVVTLKLTRFRLT